MKIKTSSSPGHFVSRDDVNTAYLNALDNPRSDRGIFNVAGPADCRTTFKSFSDEVLQYVGTPMTGIMKNIADGIHGIEEFLQFYKP